MPTHDPKFDDYIAKAQPFARPILTHLRKVVHSAVPDVQENWKWSNPAFDYKGIFCSMSAFKEHCIFGFWKHQLLIDRGVIKPDDTVLGHTRQDHLGRRPALRQRADQDPQSRRRVEPQGHQGGASESGAEAAAESAVLPPERAAEEQDSRGGVRRVQPQPQARVRRVADRGQERGHAQPPARPGRRMDVARQAAKLEIYVEMLSFIVPAHDEETLIGDTLRAIRHAGDAAGRSYEVIVVDDASTDGTAAIAAAERARVVPIAVRQIAKARNAGAAVSAGEWLIFVDADTLITPSVVQATCRAIEDGAIGGGSALRLDEASPWYAKILTQFFAWAARPVRIANGCYFFCTKPGVRAGGRLRRAAVCRRGNRAQLDAEEAGTIRAPARDGHDVRAQTANPFFSRVARHAREDRRRRTSSPPESPAARALVRSAAARSIGRLCSNPIL